MNTIDSSSNESEFEGEVATLFHEMPVPVRPSDIETAEWVVARVGNQEGTVSRRSNGKIAMRIVAPVLAVAAAMLIMVSLLPVDDGFAQVVTQIKKATTATFAIDIKANGQPEISGKAFLRNPKMIRIDFSVREQTNTNITDYEAGKLYSFSDGSSATVHDVPTDSGLDLLRSLQHDDVITNQLPDSENKIAGTTLYEFEYGGVASGRIWVNKSSRLPHRIESRTAPEVGGVRTVFSDFNWDPMLADEVFEIPADRKIVRNDLMAEPTEEELIAVLRIRDAFTSKPFAQNFLDDNPSLTIGRLAYDLSKSREENNAIQLEKLGPAFEAIGLSGAEARNPKTVQQRIDYLCMKLDEWSDIIKERGGWIGGGVSSGDAESLCWWKSYVTGEIRVLYADLTIKTSDQPPTEE